jgi:hypothetical protein
MLCSVLELRSGDQPDRASGWFLTGSCKKPWARAQWLIVLKQSLVLRRWPDSNPLSVDRLAKIATNLEFVLPAIFSVAFLKDQVWRSI